VDRRSGARGRFRTRVSFSDARREVAGVQRGTAISAVYGTVRIELRLRCVCGRKTTGLFGWPNLSLPAAGRSVKVWKGRITSNHR